jgi:hypothetical protein
VVGEFDEARIERFDPIDSAPNVTAATITTKTAVMIL